MSAIVKESGATAGSGAFHDTVLPSADTDTVPFCFLYRAGALDMLKGEGGYCRSQSW